MHGGPEVYYAPSDEESACGQIDSWQSSRVVSRLPHPNGSVFDFVRVVVHFASETLYISRDMFALLYQGTVVQTHTLSNFFLYNLP